MSDYSIDIGEANRPEDAPTSEACTAADLLAEYEDFGSDIRRVLGCIERPLKWYINVVYPHLPTYVKGHVALLGDAAGVYLCSQLRLILSGPMSFFRFGRHMGCYPIYMPGLGRESKMRISSVGY